MKAPLRFVVPFNKRKQSFEVYIWYDNEAFWDRFDQRDRKTIATYDEKTDRYLRTGPFGVINVLWDYFTLDTVVHECVHLLVDWMKTRRMKISDRNEERVAYLFDEITRNFWDAYRRAKKR